MQAVTIVVVAVVVAEAAGSTLVKGAAVSGLVVGFVWLLLGYAFDRWLYAAIGSLVERPDQVQTVALPVQLPLLFGYIVSLTAIGTTNPSLLIRVLAYFPPHGAIRDDAALLRRGCQLVAGHRLGADHDRGNRRPRAARRDHLLAR